MTDTDCANLTAKVFVANTNDIDTIFQNGQILTQYVGFEGNPTMDTVPIQTVHMAIEGILARRKDSRQDGTLERTLERSYTRTYQGVLS